MPITLSINSKVTQVESSEELRRTLEPFASEQYREIWISANRGGSSLAALLNGNIGWLMYLRHDDGDAGLSSRNPTFDAPQWIADGLPVSRFGGVLVPTMTYRLANGQIDEYPASWALPEAEVLRALDFFVDYDGDRAPFVHWHDDES